jgi:fumarylacetoacetase
MESNNQNLTSWIQYNTETETFPIQNIPFGVCKFSENKFACCTRISNKVINLHTLETSNLLNSEFFKYNENNKIFNEKNLNSFIELGKNTWKAIRNSVQNIFSNKSFENNEQVLSSIHDISNVEMMLPVKIGDYTDFYSSKNHAFNMGAIIRGPENALQPNWVHLPVGYHGNFYLYFFIFYFIK